MPDRNRVGRGYFNEREVKCIQSLLALPDESYTTRADYVRIPDTTLKTIKWRLEDNGVIFRRLVPNPGLLGVSQIHIFLARPIEKTIEAVGDTLKALPQTVVLWSEWTTCSVFAVVFTSSAAEFERIQTRIAAGRFGRVWAYLCVSPDSSSIPVYFDYAGAWSSFSGLRPRAPLAEDRYPRAMPQRNQIGEGRDLEVPSSLDRDERVAFAVAKERRDAIAMLLRSPGSPSDTTETDVRPSPFSGLSGPRRLEPGSDLSAYHGELEWRFFPVLSKLRRYENRRISHLKFHTGFLREATKGSEFLHALIQECYWCPILFVQQLNQVFFITLDVDIPLTKCFDDEQSGGAIAKRTMDRFLDPTRTDFLRIPVENLRRWVDQSYAELAREIQRLQDRLSVIDHDSEGNPHQS